MPRLEPRDVRFFATPTELRDWLEGNHAIATELWAGFRTKRSGLPSLTWPELVDEVLCVGWIDGVRMPLDDGSCIRVTPRRPGSIWSARNVGRVEALRAEGRMQDSGEAAFARRRDERTAVYSFDAGLALDAEAEAALAGADGAMAFWQAQPVGYRRSATHWVMSAKRPETRAMRLEALVAGCAAGTRLPALSGRARTREPLSRPG